VRPASGRPDAGAGMRRGSRCGQAMRVAITGRGCGRPVTDGRTLEAVADGRTLEAVADGP
ncbi:hypothetical protein ABT314_38030, partial [Streptomyces spiralis]